jgi:hypothetical protein
VGFFSPTKEKVVVQKETRAFIWFWTMDILHPKETFFFESFCGFTKTKSIMGLFFGRDERFFLGGEEDFLNRNITHRSATTNKQTNDAKAAFAPRVFLEPMIFWEFSTNRPSVGRLFFNYISKRERKGIQPHKKSAAWVV